MAHGEPAEGDDVAKTWRKSWKSLIREKEVGSGKDKVVEEEREDDEEGKEETKKETNSGFQKTTSGEAVTEAEQRRVCCQGFLDSNSLQNLRNWRQESEKRLTDFEQHVIWEKGTEMAGSGKYDKFYPPQGYFACKVFITPKELRLIIIGLWATVVFRRIQVRQRLRVACIRQVRGRKREDDGRFVAVHWTDY